MSSVVDPRSTRETLVKLLDDHTLLAIPVRGTEYSYICRCGESKNTASTSLAAQTNHKEHVADEVIGWANRLGVRI